MNMIADDFNKLRNLKEFDLAGFQIIPVNDTGWLEVKFLIKSKELEEYFNEKETQSI